MTYRGFSLTTHQFGIEIKEGAEHCGFSDNLEQAKAVCDEIMEGRRTGRFIGQYVPA